MTLVEHLPPVLARARRAGLGQESAEDTALRVLVQFHRRTGPPWLLRVDDRVRLDVLTALAIIRRRREDRTAQP